MFLYTCYGHIKNNQNQYINLYNKNTLFHVTGSKVRVTVGGFISLEKRLLAGRRKMDTPVTLPTGRYTAHCVARHGSVLVH